MGELLSVRLALNPLPSHPPKGQAESVQAAQAVLFRLFGVGQGNHNLNRCCTDAGCDFGFYRAAATSRFAG